MKHDPVAEQVAGEIVALLTLCQQLQSEKDCQKRPIPLIYSRDEDEFADRISAACGQALRLRQLLPMAMTLSAIGAEMERRGEITLLPGQDYAQKVLVRLAEQYLSPKDDKQ